MIITFCGHAQIIHRETLLDQILSVIDERARGEDILFYLGGYGDFDAIAKRACLIYKEGHPSARLIFVTPYPDDSYLKNRIIALSDYDEIIYPEIENTPPHYAIPKRNEWMVKQADLLIAYVNYGWGGAAKTLEYALRHKKTFVNLGQKNYDK